MSEFLEKYKERERSHTLHTIKIFQSIEHVTIGIIKFLETKADLCRWDEILIADNFVIISLRHIKLEEEHAEKFTVGLPLQMVMDGTKEQIIAYLDAHNNVPDFQVIDEEEILYNQQNKPPEKLPSKLIDFAEEMYLYDTDGKRKIN